MATLQELLNQKAELDRQITQMQGAARADAIAKVKALMAEYGLSVADVTTRTVRPSATEQTARAKVAAKYKDEQGNSWSGRGLKPRWMQEALAAGKTLDDFRI